MGVSGSGKSTFGMAIASALRLPFVDGDELHSPESISKMRRGIPLRDEDRKPWLDAIAAKLADTRLYSDGIIVACSALKLDYRNRLRSAARVRFIFLNADEALATHRLSERAHHFMPQSLIESQFHDLERPTAAEADVLTVPASMPLEAAVAAALAYLCRAH
ncbi:MAG TPA: gluconokinase [Steroidobacteraceae bacterium]